MGGMASPRLRAAVLCCCWAGVATQAVVTLRGATPPCSDQPGFDKARSEWCIGQTEPYACYKPAGTAELWDCHVTSPEGCSNNGRPCQWSASTSPAAPTGAPATTASPPPTPPAPPLTPPPPKAGAPVRFLSWNVYYANLGARARAIAEGINMVNPEIASLQETVNFKSNILDELKLVTGHDWAMTSTQGCEWYFDGTIYYRNDLWEKQDEGNLPYGSGGCYDGARRGLNWAALRRRSDGAGVLVFGTHPVCCQGDLPVLQALQILAGEMTARQQQFNYPIALMADMNTGYFEASQQMLRTGSADAFGRKWSFPMTFVDAWASSHPGDPNPSTIGNAPVRIDFVYFQRSPMDLGAEEGGQIWPNLPGGSDHRAVSGDVLIR